MSGAAAASSGTKGYAEMGIEEKLPSGVMLGTVEGLAGYFRKASLWPATFGLIEMVLFIATIFVAYAYVWRRGGLEWD